MWRERMRSHPDLTAAFGWLSAYLAVTLTGQGFDTGYLDYGWQIVPWSVLADDPLGSVWHLHIQPPLWNLTLGLAGKLSPFSDALTLRGLQLVIGLLLVIVVARVVRALGAPSLATVALTLVVTLNPEVLHNAFEPTYELAVARLLAVVVRTAQRAVAQRRGIDYVWFSVAITTVVLTRSLYHPAVVPLLLLALGWVLRRSLTRRHVLIAAAVPTVLVGGWLLKNQLMFGDATMSSWVGMNLQRSTIPILDRVELERMHAAGEISDIAMIGPFGNYGLYEDSMPPCTPRHSHAAHTNQGHLDPYGVIIPNFNYECFLPVYEQAGRDFWAVAREHPSVWVEGRVFSLRMTFTTSSRPSGSDSVLMRGLDEAYHLLRLDARGGVSTMDWGTPLYGAFNLTVRFSLAVIALYSLLALYSVLAVGRRVLRRPGSDTDPVHLVTFVLVGFLGAFTVAVGAIGELGEQARFRAMTDPIVLAAATLLTARLLRRWLGTPPAAPTVATTVEEAS